jgi:hypothetical protein
MKKTLCLFTLLCFQVLSFSQTIPPPYINYQAVLYDVNGPNPNAVLANQSFPTYVNIQDELGNLLYKEEHYASTDANGQITVKIGDGVYLQGPITNFNQINWGTGKYYLIVDFDINGTISSTAPEQLVTVPYTYYAGKAGNGMTAVADNGNGTLTFTYANGQTYITPTLSGIQGPIGPAGPAGPQGPQGVPGPQGIAGTNGANGTNGTNGANGQNTLVKTTTEIAGANCATGGVKIEYGLDANNNGTLDVSEINATLTKFVCNGAVGATGATGLQGPIGDIGPAGTQGPQGVQGPAGSNGTNAGVGGFTHYLGEAFNGGIIYYLYKGSDGLEHGLIVALTQQSNTTWQTTGTLVNANRTEDGAYNTNLMTGSPAATYIATLGAGWYLPSIDELVLLYNNRFSVQKALRTGGNTLLSGSAYYWSSTEYNVVYAYYYGHPFEFNNGTPSYGDKTRTYTVRAVRAF